MNIIDLSNALEARLRWEKPERDRTGLTMEVGANMNAKLEKVPSETPRTPAEPEEPEDDVDEAGEESFPASDPPAWTAAIAH